jgi:hypothetical protein
MTMRRRLHVVEYDNSGYHTAITREALVLGISHKKDMQITLPIRRFKTFHFIGTEESKQQSGSEGASELDNLLLSPLIYLMEEPSCCSDIKQIVIGTLSWWLVEAGVELIHNSFPVNLRLDLGAQTLATEHAT